MEPIYKPSAPIASIKSFNPPNEVSSYYIQWLIGKSLSPNVQRLKSLEFSTGYVSAAFDADLFPLSVAFPSEWQFEYFIDEETKSNNISLTRAPYRGSMGPFNVPIICRLAVMNKITGITKYNVSRFLGSTIEDDYNWKLSVDETRDLDHPNGDYVVYCWLDFPKEVIRGKPPITFSSRGDSGLVLLASGVASLFEEVVSSKTDDSMGTSDIVLITEKGVQRKERRFHCHRAILTIRSPVFNTMLASKRFREGTERDVDIEEINGDVLEIVLKYIYTGELPSIADFDTIRRVINVAEKYMLLELKDQCVFQLINCDVHDDAWADRMALSETYNIRILKQISTLALSSNLRAMGDKEIREKLSDEAITKLMDMAAKRGECSRIKVVKNSK